MSSISGRRHVLLFAGQGSQRRGMGDRLWDEFASLADSASEILGYSIVELCLKDPDDRLRETRYAQPAIYVANALHFYSRQRREPAADVHIGHSLGEYSALLAADCFDFEMGLKLVQRRAELTAEIEGAHLMAVVGLAVETLRSILDESGLAGIDLANINSPTQAVIAGDQASIAQAERALTARGARLVPLNVSAPFHSRYMRPAQEKFSAYLSTFTFQEPRSAVIANATARPYAGEDVATLLARQIASPVLWSDSIRYVMREGPFDYTEIASRPDQIGGAPLSKLVDEIRGADAPSEAPPPRTRRSASKKKGESVRKLPPRTRPKKTDAHREAPHAEPIAVIGMSGSFAGAPDVSTLWTNLRAGRDSVSELPESRWSGASEPTFRSAGVMEGVDEFDPRFFGISPREAVEMDPQQRLLMTHVYQAIEDAGYSPASLTGSDTALLVGTMMSGYGQILARSGHTMTETRATGTVASVGPNRMSYWLNWRGPSEPIETACSSSLVAVHRAMMLLRSGQCAMTVAGGVSTLWGDLQHSFGEAGLLGASGRCRTFSADADGYVRGEGVGMLVLKPLAAAERDGDHVYGLLRGSAQNHGGRARSLTAPNPSAQAELITAAVRQAGIDPRAINYIEAHGTGTVRGDPIEVEGLRRAFRALAENEALPEASIGLGTIKTNIGHTELAAGMAGLIKVLLQLKHREFVPSLHTAPLNPRLKLEGGPFYVVNENRAWPALTDEAGRTLPRCAGVSSFGFGGVNAHVVVEEYVTPPRTKMPPDGPVVVMLSARTEAQLQAQSARLRAHLEEHEENLADIAYTLQVGRAALAHRLALVVDSMSALRERLAAFEAGEADPESVHRGVVADEANKDGGDPSTDNGESSTAAEAGTGRDALGQSAKAWVQGAEIDRAGLWGEARPRRVSLPTYPFERERHWPGGRPDAPAEAARIAEGEAAPADSPLCFEETWQAEPLQEAAPGRAAAGGTLVCLLSDPDRQRAMERFLAERTPRYHAVFVGEVPTGGRDRAALLERFSADHGPIAALLDLQALETRGRADDLDGLIGAVSGPLGWLQGMALCGTACPRLILAGHAQDDAGQAFLEAWIGVARSLGLVLPDTRMTVLAERAPAAAAFDVWLERLWGELATASTRSVLYRDQQRHVGRIARLSLPTAGEDQARGAAPTKFRSGGTYWITGGLGGLGFALSERLARNHRANLVLSGRGPLDAQKRERIAGLEKCGSRVLYAQADAGDAAAMAEILATAEERFGRVDGVIHAAGIGTTRSLLETDAADFAAGLHAKIAGIRRLEAFLEDRRIGFVCGFSSVSAVLGDFGAGAYAMGNRYLQARARLRREAVERGEKQDGAPDRMVSIGWPLWREGGMRVGEAAQTRLYLESSGQRALETEEGLDLLESLLGSGSVQPLVFAGASERITGFLEAAVAGPSAAAEASEAKAGSEASGGSAAGRPGRGDLWGLALPESVAWDLTDEVQAFLGVDRKELDPDRNVAEYGFDSIGLVAFARRLSERYGFPLTPAAFFSHPTIGRFAAHLVDAHGPAITNFFRSDDAGRSEEPAVRPPSPSPSVPAADPPPTPNDRPEPIAIIGMSGRFPASRTIDDLWDVLRDGREVIGPFPAERLEGSAFQGQAVDQKMGAVPGVAEFDPQFFEISPREADGMDPRQRLLMQEAWRALEDAGYGSLHLKRHTVGMFVGVEQGDYQFLAGVTTAGVTANHDGVLASRLAYALDLTGPVMAINTACSSGLVAMHQACASLRAGECDTTIAAGVNLLLTPVALQAMSKAGMLSAQGHCRAFARDADGMVAAEAVVAVVLKRLSQARADGDPIRAVILGSGVNYDGHTNGITAPSGLAQTRLLRGVYDRHGIDPAELDYVVAHGTGTTLGDPIEINALNDAFEGSTDRRQFCALTSSKSNLGHSMAASGLVSLVALTQAMQHALIPASLHCGQESEHILWESSPFYVNKSTKSWPDGPKGRRLGAVSAFGISGTNAHVVVASAPCEAREDEKAPSGSPVLLAVSAKTVAALRERASALAAAIETQHRDPRALRAISHTLLNGRQHFRYRGAVVVNSREDAIQALRHLAGEGDQPNLVRGEVSRDFAAQKLLQNFGSDLLDKMSEGSADTPKGMTQQETLMGLADMYCQGYDLPWDRLFGAHPPRRIGLPGYPFARDQYWLASSGEDARSHASISTDAEHATSPRAAGSTRAAADATDTGSGDVAPEEKHAGPANAPPEPAAALEDQLSDLVADHLKLSRQAVDRRKPFAEFGFDSILAASFSTALSQRYGIALSPMVFFEEPTIEALAQHLVGEHGPNLASELAPASSTPLSDTPPAAKGDKDDEGEKTDEGEVSPAAPTLVEAHFGDQGTDEPIAIIGMSGRFPDADDVQTYWDNLKAGRDCIGEIPPNRRSGTFLEGEGSKANGKGAWAGLIEGVGIPNHRFSKLSRLPPGVTLTAEQDLFVATVDDLIGNARYSIESLLGRHGPQIGLYLGAMPADESSGTLASDVSRIFEFYGPSIAVNAHSASSLTAVHMACLGLQAKECKVAVAGGVGLFAPSVDGVDAMMASQRKHRSFSRHSDGLHFADGVGAVLLKPLRAAHRDGDQILATIRSSGASYIGSTSSMAPRAEMACLSIVPDADALATSIRHTIEKSGVDPRTIGYVEAAATGLPMGDAIELKSLIKAFGTAEEARYCALGSVESNIGHTAAASGVCGMIKTVLQLMHGTLVPTINFTDSHPSLQSSKSPFFLSNEIIKWPIIDHSSSNNGEYLPRRALVNSIGYGGFYAGVLVEEYITRTETRSARESDNGGGREGRGEIARELVLARRWPIERDEVTNPLVAAGADAAARHDPDAEAAHGGQRPTAHGLRVT